MDPTNEPLRRDRSGARVAGALATALCRADARTLAALGVVLDFVAGWAPGRPR